MIFLNPIISNKILYIADESKTHVFLSLFFNVYLRLKISIQYEIMESSPRFMFCRNLKKKKKKKTAMCSKSSNVATSSDQCRDIMWRVSRHDLIVTTSVMPQIPECLVDNRQPAEYPCLIL